MPLTPPPNQVPLVVDLDGTLINTDLLWEYLAQSLRRNPFSIFAILFWWTRGRANLKKQLAVRSKIDPSTLPYIKKFIAWVREQKATGRPIILATASDLQMAKPVADHIGIFDEVLGSDGKTNLRSENKLKALVAKFGERGFDYAGNSPPDLAVWRGARQAIVVNASHSLVVAASQCAPVGETFLDGYSPIAIPLRVLHEMLIRSGYLLAGAAGILLAMAFPRFNIAGLAWVAPGLLIFAAHNKSRCDAFRVGYAGGLVFWLVSLYWLLLIPAGAYPIPGWIALSAFMAMYFGAWLWLVQWKADSWSMRLIWSLTGAAAWVAMEMIRARFLGGFPWNFIGVSQFQMTPLIQTASVTGVYGVSFLVVWASLSLYSAGRMVFVKSRSRFAWQPEVFLPLFVVAGLFAWGEFKMLKPQLSSPILSITMVQPSIPQTLIWDENSNSNRFQQLLVQSSAALANQTDLLLWPESAVPDLNDSNYDAITNFVRTHHVWIILNADDVEPKANPTPTEPYDYFNAAFLFDPNGRWDGVYHKQKLVIFGEYIPRIPFMKWFTPITGSYQAGNEPVQFVLQRQGSTQALQVQLTNNPSAMPPSQTVTASPLICFEDMFPQVGRPAARSETDFLVNLTNDGWFGNSAEQWQHMAGALFRAVENGIPLVRCCNNGITCWIDGNGRIHDILRDKNGTVYGVGAETIELPLHPHTPTYYNRHGDWFGWDCVGLTLVVFGGRLVQWKRKG